MSTFNGKFEYTNRKGETVTAAKALAWLNRDAEGGEVMSVEEIVCRYYFREKALADNKARQDSGVLASRLYTPDLTKVEDQYIPPVLDSAVETIAAVGADLASGKNPRNAGRSAAKAAVKPTVRKAPKTEAERKAKLAENEARIKALESKMAEAKAS